jgi:gliding motility-associated-like protein
MKYQSILNFGLLLSLLFFSQIIWATHNRAGEITYRQTGALTIEATIVTYTKISGQAIHADRDQLDLHWGDGTMSTVQRDFFTMVHNDIRKNVYTTTHTYPGPNPANQPYVMWMQDPNRNENILNINGGNSVNIEFYLQTEVYLFPSAIFGNNSSPILLEPPIDFGVVGQVFMHTPNGYDPDGDSVAYELIEPFSDVGTIVPGYQEVDLIAPGPTNNYTFDPLTGLFTWDAPQQAGEYNIAILVKSYRNGIYMGGIVRDIQIEIYAAQNTPPQLDVPEEICVEAGSLINFDVIATDTDFPNQFVTLTATGGPLEINNNPATFTNTTGFSPVTSTFNWQTTCDHIQQQPWQVVFKARDSFLTTAGDDASLATFRVLRIRVVGPPVENLQSSVSSGQVTLNWDAPYLCQNAAGFLGFSVWRKNTCDGTMPDSCTVGLAGLGYTQLNFGALVLPPAQNPSSFEYVDNTVQSGAIYSYRVLPEFATPIPGTNNFLGPVSGYSSDELCVQMAQDLPLITNVDVNNTDITTGELEVRWAPPRANELDTTLNTPPYRYELFYSDDMDGLQFQVSPVYSSPVYNSYSALPDTSFYDHQNINTQDHGNSYRLAFFANGDTLGYTNLASSVFLEVNASDQTNVLNWTANVPWTNYRYVIFLESPTASGNFVVLDTVTQQTYTHNGLNNGETYCYYIESTGTYGIPGVPDSLINKSQIACGTPLDTIAPCPPIAIASISGCEAFQDDSGDEDRGLCEGFIRVQADLANTISWQKPTDSCGLDIAKYRLYFSPYCTGNYELVAEFDNLEDTSYIHQPSEDNLAGCYYVTAIDSVEGNGGGNESLPSEIVETDNCPFYELPNVFTPNNDGDNDLFHPCLPYRYIASVDFKVYNRWGGLVFQTTDPEINWDGRDMNNGQLLAEDVYYYTCNITLNCLNCEPVQPKKGVIHIIRGGRGQ